MFFYVTLLGVMALIVNVEALISPNIKYTRLILNLFSVTFVLLIGFRHEVGGDWFNYQNYLRSFEDTPLRDILTSDPGYALLNWLGSNLWGGIYTVNLISSILLIYGLRIFCLQQPLPLLAFLIATPYLLIVVGCGYTRQSIAIGIFLLAISYIYKNKAHHYVTWILVATLFHKSAAVMLVFSIFFMTKDWVKVSLTLIIFTFFFIESNLFDLNRYIVIYLEETYKSQGAVYRIIITLLSAFIFILSYRHFTMPSNVKQFWLLMTAGSALLSLLIILLPENTTAIDRINLYWIPFQIMIFSQLPVIYNIKIINYPVVLLGVSLYCVMLLVIWLYYSLHAYQWTPYKFYPWVWWWYE